MKRTGEILKKSRQEKNISIHEVAQSIKVSSRVLKAIEDGDVKNLPAKTFLRGFVQSYSNFLKIDADHVLTVFQEEMGQSEKAYHVEPATLNLMPDLKSLKNQIAEENSQASRSSASITPKEAKEKPIHIGDNNQNKIITISIIILVLGSLIGFTMKMIEKYTKEATLPDNTQEAVVQPIDATIKNEGSKPEVQITPENTSVTASPTPSATATPPPAASLLIAPKNTPTPVSTPLQTPTPLVTPTPTATPTPKPSSTPSVTANQTPTVKPSPSLSTSPTLTPKSSATPVPMKNIELIIEAKDKVEIEYTTNSGASGKIILTKDQVHTFKSKNGLNLNFSNGAAVNLILNGKDLGSPSKSKDALKLSY